MELHGIHESLQVHDADIAGSAFSNVRAVKSSFDNVNLQQASFSNANLAHATFRDVDLSNASIADAHLAGMRIDGILVVDLLETYRRSQSR